MTRRLLIAAQAALVAGVVAYAAHAVTGGGRDGGFFEDWLYNGLLAGAALLCLARGAFVRTDRAAWLALGAGLASWSAGVLDTTLFAQAHPAGFPSRTDLLWLGFYPAAYAALVLLVRSRVHELRVTLWLDGVVGALGLGAVTATLVLPVLVEAGGGDGSAVLANLSYPVADLVLGAFVLWVIALTEWRPGRILGLVAAALLAGAFVDVFSLWAAVSGHQTAVLDWLWPASAVLLAVAAWRPARDEALVDLGGLRPLVPPVVFAASALALIVYSRSHDVAAAGFGLACATLAAGIARMAVTFAENLQLLAASRQEALTDPLTALGNRRRLLRDLEHGIAEGVPNGLVICDLDGFKGYNDAFGHPAGDALLARLGARLREVIGDDGRAYRLGGDEFCVLVRLDARTLETVCEDAAVALSERGPGFAVGTSMGAVRVPAEATAVSTALQIADERLYTHKSRRRRGFGRSRDEHQTLAVLRQLLQEREPALHDHVDGVAALARRTGERLGMTGDELDELARAAHLHDVGKMAIPDRILSKPGALDDLEWALMHEHTVIGERILGVAPGLRSIADIVRASHESFDGTGYPDRLAGDAIPFAARIIAVCDAYDAMTSARPYSLAMAPATAVAELQRCAGTQFDPEIVQAFCAQLLDARQAPTRKAA